MFRRFASTLSVLRPRMLAQTRKSVDSLLNESREARRATKALIEEQRATRAEFRRWVDESRAHQEATARELAAIREELAAVALRESQVRSVLRAEAADDDAPAAVVVLDEERIRAHVRAALERAEMRLEPFPHVVVGDLFPADFYDELIAGIPPAELFADKPLNKRQLLVPFPLAPTRSRRVWRFMADVVGERIMTAAVVDKFREPLASWITATWPSMAADPLGPPMAMHSSDGRILLRHRGYQIPPHRDPKWGFITCLIYLVRPGDSQQWGTQLFSVDEDPEAAGAAPHWIDAKKCRLARDVPFRPNSALIFLNSNGAHGAAIPPDAEPADLERYAYQFRVGPSRRAIRELTALLPEERRAMWAGKLSM
jgi:hypothetical protein